MFIHLFVYSFNSFIYSNFIYYLLFVYLFIYLIIHFSTYLFIHSFIYLFICFFIHLFMHHSFIIQLFIIHSFIYLMFCFRWITMGRPSRSHSTFCLSLKPLSQMSLSTQESQNSLKWPPVGKSHTIYSANS